MTMSEALAVRSRMVPAHLADIVTVWIPGQGVKIDYAAIIEILIEQLDSERW
jgi:hypothetical protein